MDRVLVSHDWMGRNFEDLLLANQDKTDLLRLFNGVTAIVIGAHVRPSFYYALTGAIYLDADNFWLTADERDVIDEAPDFRSAFDRDLQYSGVWRYANSMNQNIFLPFSAASRIPRDLGYLLQESGWLMYHELGPCLGLPAGLGRAGAQSVDCPYGPTSRRDTRAAPAAIGQSDHDVSAHLGADEGAGAGQVRDRARCRYNARERHSILDPQGLVAERRRRVLRRRTGRRTSTTTRRRARTSR